MTKSVEGEFVTLARVAKTQGRHGEVAADLFSDFPERFAERHRVFALNAQGERREMELEGFWPHKGRIVLKFAGVDSISDAEGLIGSEIQIPVSERAELEEGANYISDLVGCMVVAKVAGSRTRAGVRSAAGGAVRSRRSCAAGDRRRPPGIIDSVRDGICEAR